MTNFKSDQIGMFDWSRDGKQLAFWRNTRNLNVVLKATSGECALRCTADALGLAVATVHKHITTMD